MHVFQTHGSIMAHMITLNKRYQGDNAYSASTMFDCL